MPDGDISLYKSLSVRPRTSGPAGETVTTRQKETLDNDSESLEADTFTVSGIDRLASPGSRTAIAGETRLTKTIETVDEDPEDHHDLD